MRTWDGFFRVFVVFGFGFRVWGLGFMGFMGFRGFRGFRV